MASILNTMKSILAYGWQANSLGFTGENIPAIFSEAMANGYYEIPEDNYKILLENSKRLNSESCEGYLTPNVILSCSFEVREFLDYNFWADISVIMNEYRLDNGESMFCPANSMFCPAHTDTVEIHVSKKDGSEKFSFYGLLEFDSPDWALENKVERKIYEEVRNYLHDEERRAKEAREDKEVDRLENERLERLEREENEE